MRESTHWAGCDRVHPQCLRAHALDALAAWDHWDADPNPEKGWGVGRDAAGSVAFWLRRYLMQQPSGPHLDVTPEGKVP